MKEKLMTLDEYNQAIKAINTELEKEALKVGDYVEFKGKDSYFEGTIVSIFTKLNGVDTRCVVQDDRGLLLIKNPKDAKLIK